MIYCDKATKFERINHLFLTLVVNNIKAILKISSIFFAFLENLNFTYLFPSCLFYQFFAFSENLNFKYLFPSCRWLLSCSFIFFWLPFAPRNLCQNYPEFYHFFCLLRKFELYISFSILSMIAVLLVHLLLTSICS